MPDVTRFPGTRAPNVIDADFGPALIAAERLVYAKDGARLIDGLSFRVRAGRRTVLIGPNGAGKSLALRLLHGLIMPDEGRVIWRADAAGHAARDRQAMVFQKPVLLRRSVAANLRFALKVAGVERRARAGRLAEGLDIAGLSEMAHRPARVLSGGEQQRLALARALICRPAVLFLDEPTASLDPAATAQIEALIHKAHFNDVTVVMVTHDQGQARRIADDIVFLQSGRVAEAGPANRLLSRPESDALRAWLDGRLWLPPGRG